MQSTMNGSDTCHNSAKHFFTLFFVIMTFSEFASLSTLDLAIAEVKGLVNVTRLDTVKPRSSDLILTQTKGNRCRTNRSSGTNFVRQV
jgi:hypothetical protein